ncbi:MAG: glycosyltransferase [Magnetococcus sp. XQGC-1]
MKVSIGMHIQPGAWGGGNQFGKALCAYLQSQGVTVVHNLDTTDLDLILLAEPDRKLRISAFDHTDILRYLLLKNRQCLVVHRINNTSEARQDTKKTFNHYRIHANYIADHTVFVSAWVRDRYKESGFGDRPHSIILNGADHTLWKPNTAKTSTGGKLKVVTHHWSNHWNKGFDIYQRLDHMLADPHWSNRLEFTYIGRLPDGFTLQNSHHIPPLSGQDLAEELGRHDLYLTAARHESGGNHNLEGALCGLPLIYLNSGSMAEYCDGFGIAFEEHSFEEKLEQMLVQHTDWSLKMAHFPHTSQKMSHQYLQLFQDLIANRSQIQAQRKWLKDPIRLLKILTGHDRR